MSKPEERLSNIVKSNQLIATEEISKLLDLYRDKTTGNESETRVKLCYFWHTRPLSEQQNILDLVYLRLRKVLAEKNEEEYEEEYEYRTGEYFILRTLMKVFILDLWENQSLKSLIAEFHNSLPEADGISENIKNLIKKYWLPDASLIPNLTSIKVNKLFSDFENSEQMGKKILDNLERHIYSLEWLKAPQTAIITPAIAASPTAALKTPSNARILLSGEK